MIGRLFAAAKDEIVEGRMAERANGQAENRPDNQQEGQHGLALLYQHSLYTWEDSTGLQVQTP